MSDSENNIGLNLGPHLRLYVDNKFGGWSKTQKYIGGASC